MSQITVEVPVEYRDRFSYIPLENGIFCCLDDDTDEAYRVAVTVASEIEAGALIEQFDVEVTDVFLEFPGGGAVLGFGGSLENVELLTQSIR